MLAGKFIRSYSLLSAELVLIVLLSSVAIAFHFNGLYGQDAHEYLRMMREMQDVFFHGGKMSHTIFPVMYPLIGFFLYEITGNDFIAMQLISIISFAIAFHFLKKLLSLMYAEGKATIIYLSLFFALSPYVLRFSVLSMSDMLCMMFISVATFYATTFFVQKKNSGAALSFIFCLSAVATRYAAIIIIIPILIFVSWNLIRRKQWLFLFLSLVLAIIPLLPDLLLRNRLLFFQFSGERFFNDYGSNIYSWSVLNFFRRNFLNADGWQHYTVWNILYTISNIIHPAFLFAGVAFLFFVKKKDFSSPLIILFTVIVCLYALVIAGFPYQNNRYLLQTFPFVMVIFFPAFIRCHQKFFKKKEIRISIFSMVAALQLFLFFYSSKALYQLNQTEQEIAVALRKFPNQTIYTCSINGALQSYHVQNTIVDLYSEKIDEVKLPALLLFNQVEFSDHFRNKNPMINFSFLQSNFNLLPLQSFEGGWQLFEVRK